MTRVLMGALCILLSALAGASTCFSQLSGKHRAIQPARCPFCEAAETLNSDVNPQPTPAQHNAPHITGLSNYPLDVPTGVRVMIFTPHPDDESLATAGLIKRVKEMRGEVSVVFVTNGDGYAEALKANGSGTYTSEFIEYGKRRYDEGIQAICELGLQPEDSVFLGFPDGGIDDLWSAYWSRLKPYVSPYTLFSRPEYKSSFSRMARYAGADLREEISRVLCKFDPDWIVIPDPRDQHPDHYTTTAFVLDALRRLNQEGVMPFSSDTRVLTYLVHFRDYPASSNWLENFHETGIGGFAIAEDILSSTRWTTLHLTDEELNAKKRALMAYQSQFSMLGGFISHFFRPCELYGSMDMAQVLALPQEYALYFGSRNRHD